MIAAEGEQKASKALKEASMVMAESSSALQLRYLQVRATLPSFANLAHKITSKLPLLHLCSQTLNSISVEKNSTIIFPLPMEMLSSFMTKPKPRPRK